VEPEVVSRELTLASPEAALASTAPEAPGADLSLHVAVIRFGGVGRV
jgi:hypothetical protein